MTIVGCLADLVGTKQNIVDEEDFHTAYSVRFEVYRNTDATVEAHFPHFGPKHSTLPVMGVTF